MIDSERGATTGEPSRSPSVAVVVCAYTERRWEQIGAAVESVRSQTVPAVQCILVIDHNETLLERAREAFADVLVVPNVEERGLSGGRNSGVRHAVADVVAFLDDDARADPAWLERLVAPYADRSVIGTGGAAMPAWPGSRPKWFPPEFLWVVGCSYVGLPVTSSVVRNPIGANMSFRSEAFEIAGFEAGVGRLDTLPLGCEETVFSIRIRQRVPGRTVVYVPDAVVHHQVSNDRTQPGYFLRRCFAEGLSKAMVAMYVGSEDGLESERRYVSSVLPRGIADGLTKRHGSSPARAFMIVAGLVATTAGYVTGRLRLSGFAGRVLGRTLP